MKRVFLLTLLFSSPAYPLSEEAREFMNITAKLEPVQCMKRKLRREIAMAQVEDRKDDVKALRERFAQINAEPRTAKLERRLAQLEPRLNSGKGTPRDPEDLEVISKQRRDAFYRCE